MASFLPIESELIRSGFDFIVGIDEAGRGPMAGPVVSAAVILKSKTTIPGLDDSKKLSPKARESLFDQIIESALDFSVTIIPHSTIDRINILNAVRLANLLCVQQLKNPQIALIDGRDHQILPIPHQTIIKGDQKVRSIAAASILAKVTRDLIMRRYHQQFPEYEFAKHMGYGTRLHRKLIDQFGHCEIHRKTYTFKEI